MGDFAHEHPTEWQIGKKRCPVCGDDKQPWADYEFCPYDGAALVVVEDEEG